VVIPGWMETMRRLQDITNSKYRILFPIALLSTIKLVTAAWIFERLLLEGRSFGQVFVDWDSAFYLSLAQNGYPAWEGLSKRLYAFFPAYPALIRVSFYIFHDYPLAAAVPALILGVGSVALFQLIGELYLSKTEALIGTIVFAFFPYVFLFTAVAYTEALFLFSTLACWLLHKKQHPFLAAVFAAIATLTRLYGILIIVPVAFDLARKKRIRNLWTLTFPVACLLGWSYFCFSATGDWLAPLTSQRVAWGTIGLGEMLYRVLFMNGSLPHGTDVALIAFFAILIFPVLRSFKVDSALGIYSALTFLLLLCSGSRISIVRYASFIFPIWFTFPVNGLRSALLCIPIFLIVSAALWFEFASGLWVA